MNKPLLKNVSAYISLGSNMGAKKVNLMSAIKLIADRDNMDIIEISPFYKTEPVDYIDQDWFVNAVLKVKTSEQPEQLLKILKGIEVQLKQKKKKVRFGPRIIDLDIIYYGERIVNTEKLVIPHPRMHKRCFVLKPLCDIETKIIHPVLKFTPQELLKNIDKTENQKVMPLN